ncbi:histidine kinase [uncultured Ilyobacter sp.]|nr:histidine kinase [uncultured Ilyobacter sp.]
MKNNIDYEKFCEYMTYVEKNRYEVLKTNVDWDAIYDTEDSYEDIVFSF